MIMGKKETKKNCSPLQANKTNTHKNVCSYVWLYPSLIILAVVCDSKKKPNVLVHSKIGGLVLVLSMWNYEYGEKHIINTWQKLTNDFTGFFSYFSMDS